MSSSPIAQTLSQLAQGNPTFASRFLTEPDDAPGWLSATELAAADTPYLQQIFTRVVGHYPTQDKRAPAALWLGHYAYGVEAVAIACYLGGRRVLDLSPQTVWVRLEDDGDVAAMAWRSDKFVALPDDPAAADANCTVVESPAALRDELRAQLVDHLTPMINAVSARSPFGKAGMWALSADYCASAFAWVGELMGDERAGAAEARAFGAPPSRLALRRDFILVEQSGLSYHLLDRTACCLYYKCEGGEYCSACPLRPREERITLIKSWLERRAAGG